jgi:nucleoside-diphosphate-sugar epimerase
VKRQGGDVSIIAWGRMVGRALEAAEQVAADGVDVEVLDPRGLRPLDVDAIVATVEKTGRVILTHEAPKTGGAAAEVAAIIAEEALTALDAPIRRVSPWTLEGVVLDERPLHRVDLRRGVSQPGAAALSWRCGRTCIPRSKEPVMRVFVAGATGAIGRQLVPRLVAAGHEVHGMTRSESKQPMLFELGAVPVVADALDPDQVAEAVGRARPDVIVHQLTALAGVERYMERAAAPTNRLRTQGTDHLLSAGQAVGVRRFVAQGVAGYGAYGRSGVPVKSEEDPLDPAPVREMRETLAAIRHLEAAVLGAKWTEGIVLRYGVFYGPGTSLAAGAEQFELVRRRKFPLVGDGGGVWSFIHVADAAEATVAAIEQGTRGVYNVVDDDPAPVAEWLPALAQTLGAKKPMRVPRFIGRLFAGQAGAVMMTEIRGASNAKAKRELAWRPAHPSWRQGFAAA